MLYSFSSVLFFQFLKFFLLPLLPHQCRQVKIFLWPPLAGRSRHTKLLRSGLWTTLLECYLIAALNHAIARRRGPWMSNRQRPWMQWLCYLEWGCLRLRPSMRQQCGLSPATYIVIRCGSVQKIGIVPLLSIPTFYAKYKFNINISISLSG